MDTASTSFHWLCSRAALAFRPLRLAAVRSGCWTTRRTHTLSACARPQPRTTTRCHPTPCRAYEMLKRTYTGNVFKRYKFVSFHNINTDSLLRRLRRPCGRNIWAERRSKSRLPSLACDENDTRPSHSSPNSEHNVCNI